jgi:hypothetical protein
VLYKDVLNLVNDEGFEKVGRQTTENLDLVLIGKKGASSTFPHYFRHYPIILESGENSDIDDEIVAALLRWIKRYQN